MYSEDFAFKCRPNITVFRSRERKATTQMPNNLIPMTEGANLSEIGPTKSMSTYQWDGAEQTRAFLRSMQMGDAILRDMVGSRIDVQHVTAFWAPYRADEDGEVNEGIHIVLVAPDGKRITTSSPTALKDVLKPAQWGLATLPYSPAQRFKVGQGKCKTPGHTYLYLEWEGPA